MPELPEVETTVRGLKEKVTGLKITDIWTDLGKKKLSLPHFKNTIKDASFLPTLRKKIIGKKITSVTRRAKNILIHFENGETMLIHLKMTGHLLVGVYDFDKKNNSWSVHKKEKNEALRDPYNRFVHVVFSLSNHSHLVFCDSRKFGTVTLLSCHLSHVNGQSLSALGPEPLDKKFTEKILIESLMKKKNAPIKTALMDQSLVAGIGNIYSDEILFKACVSPTRKVNDISKKEFGGIFKYIKIILTKGIDFGGDSMSDYRNIEGRRGEFQKKHNVYRKKGELCGKPGCSGTIKRIVVGGRSAHFCDTHQK
jgi:formamidopyrimidine-DNA glycosylase